MTVVYPFGNYWQRLNNPLKIAIKVLVIGQFFLRHEGKTDDRTYEKQGGFFYKTQHTEFIYNLSSKIVFLAEIEK